MGDILVFHDDYHLTTALHLVTLRNANLLMSQAYLTEWKLALIYWVYSFIECTLSLSALLHWVHSCIECTLSLSALFHWVHSFIECTLWWSPLFDGVHYLIGNTFFHLVHYLIEYTRSSSALCYWMHSFFSFVECNICMFTCFTSFIVS